MEVRGEEGGPSLRKEAEEEEWRARLGRLTADLGRGVLGDHGIRGEFWMQNAAVGVGVHGQCIQQLPVL